MRLRIRSMYLPYKPDYNPDKNTKRIVETDQPFRSRQAKCSIRVKVFELGKLGECAYQEYNNEETNISYQRELPLVHLDYLNVVVLRSHSSQFWITLFKMAKVSNQKFHVQADYIQQVKDRYETPLNTIRPLATSSCVSLEYRSLIEVRQLAFDT